MNKLYEKRLEKKLSIRKLAKLADMSTDTIRRIERDMDPQNVKLETYNRLARVLNCSTLDLIPEEALVK